MKKYFFLWVMMFGTLVIQSQDIPSDNQELKKNGISLGVLGTTTYAGLTYDRMLSPKVNLEAGIGYIGIGIGLNYYLSDVKFRQVNYYMGAKFTHHTNIIEDTRSVIYIPIGITYIFKNQLTFGLDIGPAILNHFPEGHLIGEILSDDPYSDFGVYGTIKMGIRF